MWKMSSSFALCMMLCSFVYIFLNVNGVEGFDPLIQLPPNGYCRNNTIHKSKSEFNIKDYGAKGDGIADDTKTFQKVWKMACSLPSKAKVVVPAEHSYMVRPIDFLGPCKSKVTFKISGEMVAPKDPEVWNGADMNKWLYFDNVDHLTVEGGGKINGMGHEWWARSCKINESNPCQHAPTVSAILCSLENFSSAITFHRCNNLKVKNIKMIDSQQMHMEFSSCVQVEASHIKISAPRNSPNTDGIHISASTDVEVKRSDISTGDDCISVAGNSSRIKIKNVSCGPGHGISIGSLGNSNLYAQVDDVTVKGVRLSNTENGVRIKLWQGGRGHARKITFQNISMKNVSNPIIIDQYYCDSPVPCRNETLAVNIQSISFMDIKGTSATEDAIRFVCSDSSPCTQLYLEDIRLASLCGRVTKSFCKQAYGSSSGHVSPSPCFVCDRSIMQKNCLPSLLKSL